MGQRGELPAVRPLRRHPGQRLPESNVAASDPIAGGEGDDVYDGKGGGDFWADSSLMSNDSYLFLAYDFGIVLVQDRGGGSGTVDLSHYRSTDFAFSAVCTDPGHPTSLRMRGPGNRGSGKPRNGELSKRREIGVFDPGAGYSSTISS